MRDVYERLNQHYFKTLTKNFTADTHVESLTVLARDNYQIPIRVYRPASSTTPGPVIINIHGGAKVMGTFTDEEAHCRIFAHKLNATCINIEYRLAPEHKSPVALYDCWDVVQWTATHAAAELNGDPRKGFIIHGSSAGAQMVDVIGHLARDEHLYPPLTGLVEICTSSCQYNTIPSEYASEFLSWDQDIKGGIPREGLLRFYELTGVAEDPAHRFNSPLLWPSGHKGLPSVFLQVHGRDFVRDSALIYQRVLKEEGVDVRMKVYPGVPHGFNVMFCETDVAKEHEKDTLEGLRWLLARTEK
ncbi:alpha/beta-hydrolase [Corynespora cassiicola Philippines]|uniref:Alpha/beta-hydrolase n=1 Tax=Corynespora cassiicola Philippines TaxID=1448308 RepID=A0A2T2NRK9_CORCC|nr:alpha/beta-hydrolase [Corynespora cassiicola Philippines]